MYLKQSAPSLIEGLHVCNFAMEVQILDRFGCISVHKGLALTNISATTADFHWNWLLKGTLQNEANMCFLLNAGYCVGDFEEYLFVAFRRTLLYGIKGSPSSYKRIFQESMICISIRSLYFLFLFHFWNFRYK